MYSVGSFKKTNPIKLEANLSLREQRSLRVGFSESSNRGPISKGAPMLLCGIAHGLLFPIILLCLCGNFRDIRIWAERHIDNKCFAFVFSYLDNAQLFKRRFGSKVRSEQTNLCGNRLIILTATAKGHNKPFCGVRQEGVYNFSR